jgi:hypothetical protein
MAEIFDLAGRSLIEDVCEVVDIAGRLELRNRLGPRDDRQQHNNCSQL